MKQSINASTISDNHWFSTGCNSFFQCRETIESPFFQHGNNTREGKWCRWGEGWHGGKMRRIHRIEGWKERGDSRICQGVGWTNSEILNLNKWVSSHIDDVHSNLGRFRNWLFSSSGSTEILEYQKSRKSSWSIVNQVISFYQNEHIFRGCFI